MGKWLRKFYPDGKFGRYADDTIIHFESQKRAEEVKGEFESRMLDCGLEQHPEKMKIVYSKDCNQRGDYLNVSFDFPGQSSNPRMVRYNKRDVWYTSWLLAVSSKFMKAMIEKLKGMGILRASGCTR